MYKFVEDSEHSGEIRRAIIPDINATLIIIFFFVLLIIGKGIVIPETFTNIILHWTACCASRACLCNVECCIWEKQRRGMLDAERGKTMMECAHNHRSQEILSYSLKAKHAVDHGPKHEKENVNRLSVIPTRLQLTIQEEIVNRISSDTLIANENKCCAKYCANSCHGKRGDRRCCLWSHVHLNFLILWWATAPLIGYYILSDALENNFSADAMESCEYGDIRSVCHCKPDEDKWSEELFDYYGCRFPVLPVDFPRKDAWPLKDSKGQQRNYFDLLDLFELSINIEKEPQSMSKNMQGLWYRIGFMNNRLNEYLFILNILDATLGSAFTLLWFIIRGYARKPMAIFIYVLWGLMVLFFIIILIIMAPISWFTTLGFLLPWIVFAVFLSMYWCVGCCLTERQRRLSIRSMREWYYQNQRRRLSSLISWNNEWWDKMKARKSRRKK